MNQDWRVSGSVGKRHLIFHVLVSFFAEIDIF